MDRIEEIRQRTEAAKAQKEKGDSITAACIAWSIVTNDIPYLLSEVDRLQAQLAESQRRERAAVEDMKSIVKQNVSDFASGTYTTPCRYCKDLETCDYIPADGGCCFKWRGPGAGEGENNA